jgi:hypothetical protein
MIKVTRTMNNSLIIGETERTDSGYQIKDPFSIIPMEEGIRLIPLDIDLIGVQKEEIFLTDDKVMYNENTSDVIIDEYKKLLENGPEPQVQSKDEANAEKAS